MGDDRGETHVGVVLVGHRLDPEGREQQLDAAEEEGDREQREEELLPQRQFGSESFLFAAAGARVLAVDRDPRKIAAARKRQAYYEEVFGRPLEITFGKADLDVYDPTLRELSLTWLASVLANVGDQEAFLERVFQATRLGGRVMITDMNLLNPLFLFKEWRRRRRGSRRSATFRRQASFPGMFFRRRRSGARYFPDAPGKPFDDAQF